MGGRVRTWDIEPTRGGGGHGPSKKTRRKRNTKETQKITRAFCKNRKKLKKNQRKWFPPLAYLPLGVRQVKQWTPPSTGPPEPAHRPPRRRSGTAVSFGGRGTARPRPAAGEAGPEATGVVGRPAPTGGCPGPAGVGTHPPTHPQGPG